MKNIILTGVSVLLIISFNLLYKQDRTEVAIIFSVFNCNRLIKIRHSFY